MNFKDLLDYCNAQALLNKLEPTEESIWYAFCRTYAKAFYTPLYKVINMDPEHVFLMVYEDRYGDVDVEEHLETILDTVYRLEDPEYSIQKDEELDEFIKKAQEEEENRIFEKKSIMQTVKESSKKNKEKEVQETDNTLKSGFVNLSHLLDNENER